VIPLFENINNIVFMNKTTPQTLSAILRHLKQWPSFETVGLQQYRKLLEKGAAAFKQDQSVKINYVKFHHIDAAWLTPDNCQGKQTILYFHGGGYIAGSINSYKDLASRIAKASHSKALIFNYRLAPEDRFPAGLEDAKKSWEWLLSQDLSPKQIAFVSDSAGSGLCLALLSQLLKAGDPLPFCAVFISPWIDLECKSSSFEMNRLKDPMLSGKQLLAAAHLYTDQPLNDPLVSPINNDFTGLCPILIQTGENEILLDDSRILAKKAGVAGTDVTFEIWENMFHTWHYFAKYIAAGRQAIDKIGEYIKKKALET